MNEIVIDIRRFPKPLQEALRDQAIRRKMPMKDLFAEIINSTAETILATSSTQTEEDSK